MKYLKFYIPIIGLYFTLKNIENLGYHFIPTALYHAAVIYLFSKILVS